MNRCSRGEHRTGVSADTKGTTVTERNEDWNVPTKPHEWASEQQQGPETDRVGGLDVWSPAQRAVWASPLFCWFMLRTTRQRGRCKTLNRRSVETNLQGKLNPSDTIKSMSRTVGAVGAVRQASAPAGVQAAPWEMPALGIFPLFMFSSRWCRCSVLRV